VFLCNKSLMSYIYAIIHLAWLFTGSKEARVVKLVLSAYNQYKWILISISGHSTQAVDVNKSG